MAEAVFAGEVVDVLDRVRGTRRAGDAERVARIEVVEAFKGVRAGSILNVFTGYGGGDCGVEFTPGARYVIVANGGERWFTSVCSSSLERKAPELRAQMRAAAGLPPPVEPPAVDHAPQFCSRPRSWQSAIDSVDVAFTGEALSACRVSGGNGYKWRAAVAKAVKGVEAGAIVDFETSATFRWLEPWFLLSKEGERLVRDPCRTLTEVTADTEVERQEIEGEADVIEQEEEQPEENGELAVFDKTDPRTWQTPCNSLNDSVFPGDPKPESGSARSRTVDGKKSRGCAGCATSSVDGRSGPIVFAVAFACLALRRRRRARTCCQGGADAKQKTA